MINWRQYLQSLSYTRAKIMSSTMGTEFSNILDIQGDTVFISAIKNKDIETGDVFKIQFINSKLKEVGFISKAIRVMENKVMVQMISYEVDFTRHPLADMQTYWEKH